MKNVRGFLKYEINLDRNWRNSQLVYLRLVYLRLGQEQCLDFYKLIELFFEGILRNICLALCIFISPLRKNETLKKYRVCNLKCVKRKELLWATSIRLFKNAYVERKITLNFDFTKYLEAALA